MEQNEIDAVIRNLKEKALRPPLPPELVEKALSWSGRKPESEGQAFRVLCALNLLNAAAKMSYYRKSVSYKTIKTGAAALLETVIADPLRFPFPVYIDENKAAYIRMYDLQFSFHSIPLSESLLAYRDSSLNLPQDWEGVPLQMIARDLFELSLGKVSDFPG